MLRLGGTASQDHVEAFEALTAIFRKRGIDLDWVLYSGYDALVEAFVSGEVDMAWNGPLSYVKIRRLMDNPARVIAMRDVDVDFVTHFITHRNSEVRAVSDLAGRRFAFGSRGSVQAGLLPHHYLREMGIDPGSQLSAFTFHGDRTGSPASDEHDVVERVASGEYDAGAVSDLTLKSAQARPDQAPIRAFWSSPGYSHCCFTVREDLDPVLLEDIERAFLSVDPDDPDGKALLEAEACTSIVAGTEEGWDVVERAAEDEGLI